MTVSRAKSLNACTIVARRDLARARVVGESFLDHHDGSRFFVLVVDGAPADFNSRGAIELLEPSTVGLSDFPGRAFAYDAAELAASLKSVLLLFLLDHAGEKLVYLDPDVLVLVPFEKLHSILEAHPIVLVPHLIDAVPVNISAEAEKFVLLNGTYDTGFLGIRDGEETRKFLRWWESRLEKACYRGFANGHFLDQSWVSFAPAYYRSAFILRDAGYGLNCRREWFAKPVFFNARGLDVDSGRFAEETKLPAAAWPSEARQLVSRYIAQVDQAGHSRWRQCPYRYNVFSNGCPLHPFLRRIYRELAVPTRSGFGDPFDSERPDAFYDWVRTPGSRESLPPFLKAVYDARPDVAAAFPHPEGLDRTEFLRWATESAPREMGFEAEMARCLP